MGIDPDADRNLKGELPMKNFDLTTRGSLVQLTDAEIDAVGGADWVQNWVTAWNNYVDELRSPARSLH